MYGDSVRFSDANGARQKVSNYGVHLVSKLIPETVTEKLETNFVPFSPTCTVLFSVLIFQNFDAKSSLLVATVSLYT